MHKYANNIPAYIRLTALSHEVQHIGIVHSNQADIMDSPCKNYATKSNIIIPTKDIFYIIYIMHIKIQ